MRGGTETTNDQQNPSAPLLLLAKVEVFVNGNSACPSIWGACQLLRALAEGKRSMVAKHDPDVIDEAVRLIHASGGRNYADEDLDAVPFSVDENGREHLPAGTPEGGRFPSGKGGDAGEDPIRRKTKARVTVARRDREEAMDVVKKLSVKADDIPSLIGASHGATVHVTSARFGVLTVEMNHDTYKAERKIGRDDQGRKFIYNGDIKVGDNFQGQGIGARVFARQVHHAAKAGFAYIKAHCAHGQRSDGGRYNGYYTWAAMGYDAPIRSLDLSLQKKILNWFPQAKTVQDVVQSEGGRKWWKAHGRSFDGIFQLSPGSRSRRILDHYMANDAKTPPKDV